MDDLQYCINEKGETNTAVLIPPFHVCYFIGVYL